MSRFAWDDTRDPPGGEWLIARPLRALVALDVTAIALGVAAVVQLGDPDILLHVVWIVLAVEAFTFGLRIAAVRIAVASIFVIAYAVVAGGDGTPTAAAMVDLDLEEWPLMALIACLVAIMADRVTNTGRRYASLYRAASDRLLTAQEDERRRLALDLHDGVGQTMTALALTLDAADAALVGPGAPAPAARQAIRRAREMAGIALEDVRSVAFRLRPARLREAGLVAALRELASSAGMPVEFSADPTLVRPGLLDPDREVDVYRIVQEALGNATRHGQPERIRVSVRRHGRMLRLEIADDGVGFDAADVEGEGLGLASMHDRAGAVRGTLRVRSRRGTGTVVSLDVPLADIAAAPLAGELAEEPPERASAGVSAR